MQKNWLVGTLVAIVIIWIASFLPWVSVTTAGYSFFTSGFETTTVELNAWNSHFKIEGIKLPNWILVILATLIGALIFLGAGGYYTSGRWITIPFATYGLLHTVFAMTVILANASSATMGIGLPLTLIGYIVLLITVIKKPSTASLPEPETP